MNLNELRKLVKEACGDPHSEYSGKENPSGGKMARTDLVAIAKDAQELVNMFGDDSELPDWVEAKITKASDYLNSVKKYIGGEIVRQDPGMMQESDMQLRQGGADRFDVNETVKILRNVLGEIHEMVYKLSDLERMLKEKYRNEEITYYPGREFQHAMNKLASADDYGSLTKSINRYIENEISMHNMSKRKKLKEGLLDEINEIVDDEFIKTRSLSIVTMLTKVHSELAGQTALLQSVLKSLESRAV